MSFPGLLATARTVSLRIPASLLLIGRVWLPGNLESISTTIPYVWAAAQETQNAAQETKKAAHETKEEAEKTACEVDGLVTAVKALGPIQAYVVGLKVTSAGDRY